MSGNPFDPFGGAATAAPSPIQSYSSPNPYAAYGAQAAMGQQLGQQHGQQYSTQQAYGMSPEAQHQQTPEQQQYGVQQYSGMQQQQYSAPAPAQQDPWASQAQAQTPQQQPQAPQTVAAYGQQQQQQPQMQSYQQPSPVPSYQQASPAPAGNGGYNPFAASPSHQMVVSQQQSNPYADMVSPAPPAPMPATQSLVPAAQQTSPWGMPPNQGYGAPAPVGGGYDPFAPPAPPPVPVPAPPPPQAPAPPSTEPENPFGDFLPASPEPAPAPAPVDQKPPTEVAIVPSQERQMQQYASGYGQESQQQNSESRAMVPAPPSPARNKYSGELARRAPPGASPLPKAELVKKSGYVLSRISFRTIVMKKWKQSYWVQYGSHTMLWFRSDSDFNDWLNNPYHSQAQRNFLIKLAVNFVHDLYKPNVRGYQVTQCRVKPYGNKMVRQFKLERWMDYGPTIAAAFGSYDPKEVDGLREAIVECMRNTPLGNGIRATGAVRQAPERDLASSADDEEYGNGHHHHQDDNSEANQRYNSGASAYTQPSPATQRPVAASRSVVSAADLLDDRHNFDDTASLPATPGQSLVPAHNPNQAYPGAPPNPYGAPQGYPNYGQQQPNYGQQQPAPNGYPQAASPAPYPQQQQQYYQQQAYPQASQQYQQPQEYQQQQAYPTAYPVQGAQY